MLKLRLVLTGLLLACACASTASLPRAAVAGLWPSSFAPEPPQREIQQRPHPAVVRVIAPEEGGTSFGSGTLVDVRGDYGLVLTNWHVVADATHTIEVVFPDGFRTAARVITTDRTWDLAALAIWRPNVEPVKLASRPPQAGEPLTIAGYGSGKYRAVTGKCTQYVAPAMNKPYEMVELSVAARQGDSGGPIFNAQGELAGVLWGAGWGTTAGSFCGRVNAFMAAVMPPPGVGEVRSAQIAQTNPSAAAPLVPVEYNAPIVGAKPQTGAVSDHQLTSARASIGASSAARSTSEMATPATTPPAATDADPAVTIDEPSVTEQIEMFLAFVGGAALLLHSLRLLMPAK